MKRLLIGLLMIALCLAPSAATGEGEAVTSLGVSLLDVLAGDGAENPVISPLSVYIALGMAAGGARGETQNQLLALLGETQIDGVYQNCLSILDNLSANDAGVTISIANSCWIDDRFPIKEEAVNDLKEYFRAELNACALASEDTMHRVNDWASKNTAGLIEKLLSEPLNSEIAMLLANAVYFNAKWQTPFAGEENITADFTRGDETTVQAEYMIANERTYPYIELDGAKAVVLPYEGGTHAYLAILPPEGTAVRDYLKTLSSETVTDMIANAEYETVNMRLPKLNVTLNAEIKDALAQMGAADAFDPDKADFSGFSDQPICADSVIHMVNMRVDEEGTEAAAVTAILMRATSAINPNMVKQINFDRPYLYMVVDISAAQALFMGIADDPTV